MAVLNGLPGANGVQFVNAQTGGGGRPVGGGPADLDPNTVVVDGTPIRIVVLALSAAAGLTALKWAGVKFNVGVTS